MTASPTKKICEHKIRHGKVGKDSEPTTKSEKKKQDTSNTRRFQFVSRCCCFFDLAPVSQPIWKGALCAHTHTQQTHAEFKLSKKWIQQYNKNIQHTKKNCKNKQQRDTNRHVIYIESNRKCWPRSWTYLWFVPFMWPLGRKCTDKQQLEEAAKQKQKKIITRCNSCSLKTGLGRIINLLEILILFFYFFVVAQKPSVISGFGLDAKPVRCVRCVCVCTKGRHLVRATMAWWWINKSNDLQWNADLTYRNWNAIECSNREIKHTSDDWQAFFFLIYTDRSSGDSCYRSYRACNLFIQICT